MKNSSKKIISAAFVLGLLASGSAFANNTNKVVVDKYGNAVKTRLSGNCVLTKWNANGSNICTDGNTAPVAKAAPIMQKTPKAVIKEHKRSYIVFFDYNRSVLTKESASVVKDLYNDTSGATSVMFDLTGHADRVGSDQYNQMLSKKRATSVKNALVSYGADARNISVNYKGESAPLVPTKDGIKEAQNRRVEIKVTTKK